MESHPNYLYHPGNNEPKACWESESKPSGHRREGNVSPGARERLRENHGIEVEAKKQEESISRESTAHIKTLKHTALVPPSIPDTESLPVSTTASRIPTMHLTTTKQGTAAAANTPATTKLALTEQALTPSSSTPAVEVLKLSNHSEPAVGSCRSKSKSPNMSHNLKAEVGANISAKTSPKNIQKTASTSRIMGSTDCPKILHKTASVSQISSTDSPKSLKQMSLSHIPRATSSPKLKPSPTASLKVDKTDLNRRVSSPKERMIDRLAESKPQLVTNTPMLSPVRQQVHEIKSRNELIEQKVADVGQTGVTQVEHSLIGSDITILTSTGPPLESARQPSHRVTRPSTECLKEPEDKSHANVTTQETQNDMEKQAEKREKGSKRREEREAGARIKDEKAERKKDAEIKKDKMANEAKKEKTRTLISRKLLKTVEDFPVVETQDEELQTDLRPMYIDAEVQVSVEVGSKYTGMSPICSPQSCGLLNPELDLMPKVGLHNGLGTNRKSDLPTVASPDLTPMGAKPRFLGPPPYKSPNSQKPVQHVCQIEIELCSQLPQRVSSAPSTVTISELDAVCNDEQNSKGTLKTLNSVKATELKVGHEESVKPQEIVWDEQGMTWEVYGASLEVESLGFAIQNHLQCKIREHERRIRTLRKSICLSEQSPGQSRTERRKRNVFRSLFSGSKCCSNPQPKEEMIR